MRRYSRGSRPSPHLMERRRAGIPCRESGFLGTQPSSRSFRFDPARLAAKWRATSGPTSSSTDSRETPRGAAACTSRAMRADKSRNEMGASSTTR